MEREGVDLLFVPRGTDLEYLAGLERDAPTYGAHGYTHDWVAGAFFRPGHDPVFCLPRLVSLVHVKSELPGEIVVFDEPADGWALFEQVAARLGPAATVGVSSRAWAESVLRLQTAFPGARFVDGGAIVGRLRMRKSPDELAALTKATQIAVDALRQTTPLIAPGVTMREIATELERHMQLLGSKAPSFETHVATYGLADRLDNLNATADTAAALGRVGEVRLRRGRRRLLLGLRPHDLLRRALRGVRRDLRRRADPRARGRDRRVRRRVRAPATST